MKRGGILSWSRTATLLLGVSLFACSEPIVAGPDASAGPDSAVPLPSDGGEPGDAALPGGADAAVGADTGTGTGPCAAQPCFAGVECVEDSTAPGGFRCGDCPPGTEGDGIACADVDGCAADPCFAGVACTDVPAPGEGFLCGDCPPGTDGDGVACTDIDGCAANPCFAGVTCTDVPAPGEGFLCGDCPPGTEGDGIACADVDGCAAAPCFAGVTCTDVPAPGEGFDCGDCPPGYAGDGVACTDYDECAGEGGGHQCDPLAACLNVGGGYTCTCPAGYDDPQGDGTLCEDFDECQGEGLGHACDPLVACTNTAGSYDCGPCPAGYDDANGDGTLCRDTDGCQGEPCFAGVVCADVHAPGTGFTCGPCPTGYEGDGVACADIDECRLGLVHCDPLAPCVNSPGGAACLSCPPGYVDVHGDGTLCEGEAPTPGACPLADDGAAVPAGALQAFGTVPTSTWTGVVEVTGDVTVPAGATLTVEAGTTVWVSGPHRILVDGQLQVAGTEAAPVLFRTPSSGGAPLSWQGLVLAGAGGHQLAGLEIRHAARALDVRAGADIDGASLLCGQVGLEVAAGAVVQAAAVRVQGASGTGVVSRGELHAGALLALGNGGGGVYAQGGTLDLAFCAASGNGGHGLEVDGSAVQVTDCELRGNLQAGFVQRRLATGLVQRSNIVGNGLEGVRILGGGYDKNPRVSVQRCNVYGNALTGNLTTAEVTGVSAGVYGYGTSTKTWVPAQETFGVEFILNSSTYLVSADLRATDGTVLESALRGHGRWVDVAERSDESFVLRATTTCSSCSGTAYITGEAHVGPSLGYQVVVVPQAYNLSLEHNYLGAFPDVSGAVWTHSGALPLTDGLRGAPFGPAFDDYPYLGSLTLTQDTRWSGELFLTGDVTVATGATLTIDPGTAVHFVPFDDNGDGHGDVRLTVHGRLEIQGTAAEPVLIDGWAGAGPGAAAFQTIDVNGEAAISHAIIEDGLVCLSGSPTSLTLADVEVRHCVRDGVAVDNEYSPSTIAVERSRFHDNGRIGASFLGVRNALTVRDSRAFLNGDTGLRVQGYPALVERCTLEGNGLFGLWIRSAYGVGDLVTACEITGNAAEGVFVDGSAQAIAVTGNNLHGNASASTLFREGLADGSTGYDTPNDERVFLAVADYYEQSGDSFGQNSGWVSGVDAGGVATVACRFTYSASPGYCDVHAVAGSVGVRSGVTRNNPNIISSMSLEEVVYHRLVSELPRVLELTALRGTVTATGNYWGGAAATGVVQHLAGGAVDVGGELASPVPGAGAP